MPVASVARADVARAHRPVEDVSPLWLSHHWPHDYDRCVVVGSRHVCRRCLVTYPLAFAVLVLGVAGLRAPAGWELAGYALLPLPALAEFVVEHLGHTRHSPRRLVAVSIPLGIGLGLGFTRYVHDPTDPWFWAITVIDAGVAFAAWLTGRRWSASR